MARIHAGMVAIKDQVGFKGDLHAFFDYMRSSPKFQPKSREQLTRDFYRIKTAVEATKLGAFDFIEKPPESERILLLARNALSQKRLSDENRRLKLSFDDLLVSAGAARPATDSITVRGWRRKSAVQPSARSPRCNAAHSLRSFIKVEVPWALT